jgi:excisionase family DNA binding protein
MAEDPRGLPPILTITEAARYLRINRKTLYAIARRRKLPGCRRLGRTLRIDRDELVAWFRAEHPRRLEK